MKNFAWLMDLLFGSARAHTCPKSGQVYRVRYWTKWVCTFWGAVVGFMALVILIGVGKKLFGVLVLLWLWRFAKEDEHFWLGQFD